MQMLVKQMITIPPSPLSDCDCELYKRVETILNHNDSFIKFMLSIQNECMENQRDNMICDKWTKDMDENMPRKLKVLINNYTIQDKEGILHIYFTLVRKPSLCPPTLSISHVEVA